MADGKDDLEKYLDNALNEKDRHALEKKALDDNFLSDAVDGAESISPKDFSKDVGELKKKIGGKPSASWFTPLRIAAGIIVLLTTGSLIYFFGFDPQNNLTENSETISAHEEAPAVGKDVDSTLITMAKPEPGEKNKSALSQPETTKEYSTKSGASEAGPKTKPDEKKDESEKSGQVILAEDKSELKSDETGDVEMAEVSPVQSAPALQRSEMRKKDINSATGLSNAKSYKINLQLVEGNVKAEDGSPLPGVNVILKGTDEGTVTDANGYFKLNVSNNKQPILFSFIGMVPEEIVPQDKNNLQVTLKEDLTQLSEVVVTGLSLNDDQKENPVIKNASPVGGIKAYNKYLETSLRYPQQALDNNVKGKVTLSFTITENGVLSEFTIVKGLGYGCDDEVIRLVKEGPRWEPTTVNRTPVDTEVKVRVKFDPDKVKR